MTIEDDFNAAAEKLASSFTELYAAHCSKTQKMFVVLAMTGALAACATEAGMDRHKLVAALNSAFDDIDEHPDAD